MKYQKIDSIKFTIPKTEEDKTWVIVKFENGTQWVPSLLDLADILSKIGMCEDIKYPKGKGYKYTQEFINKCFNKTRREILFLYKNCYDPNDLLKID